MRKYSLQSLWCVSQIRNYLPNEIRGECGFCSQPQYRLRENHIRESLQVRYFFRLSLSLFVRFFSDVLDWSIAFDLFTARRLFKARWIAKFVFISAGSFVPFPDSCSAGVIFYSINNTRWISLLTSLKFSFLFTSQRFFLFIRLFISSGICFNLISVNLNCFLHIALIELYVGLLVFCWHCRGKLRLCLNVLCSYTSITHLGCDVTNLL